MLATSALSVVSAASACSDPDNASSLTPAERNFVNYYGRYYPKGASPQQVLTLAEGTCTLLRQGYPLKTITEQVKIIIPALTNEEAAEAVVRSADAECPEMAARFRTGAQ